MAKSTPVHFHKRHGTSTAKRMLAAKRMLQDALLLAAGGVDEASLRALGVGSA